ncbi:MAG TPA: hypothetical protein VHN37_04110 [Actinomycetota bacterium]|nr:hypothetical protein [Actinomycetota bacterium]
MIDPVLAHGVGRVYESPIPAYLYAVGAGLTVLLSFVLRALAGNRAPATRDREVAGAGAARTVRTILKAGALAGLALTVAGAVLVDERGLTVAPLLFWVGLVVGTTTLCFFVGGAWEAADPWATLEGYYRIEDSEAEPLTPPWWTGPALVYALFWFELVSGVGFEPAGVLGALVVYSVLSFSLRHRLGPGWRLVDPLSILFGFASATSPLELRDDSVRYRGLGGIDRPEPMPRALFASIFVLLASTTLDNVTETVGWSKLVTSTGLDALPGEVVESVAFVAFALLFLAPFLGAIALGGARARGSSSLYAAARAFGWSLVPIGVAYVVAHNAPLLITGIPQLLRTLSDPFGYGWNLFGTAALWSDFSPSPQLVWYLEIALIVGGHVLGVLAAHRTAVRVAGDHAGAVRSQYALTALMSVYTIATLWLLAQPLVR